MKNSFPPPYRGKTVTPNVINTVQMGKALERQTVERDCQILVAVVLASLLVIGLSVVIGNIIFALRQERMLGHFRYQVAPRGTLISVDGQGEVRLRRHAARAFRAMQAAALAEGVRLLAVSGFRDARHQRKLFFAEAARKGESVWQRAYVCAPPGYSEHHTGYSLDIGDGIRRDSQLQLRFKDTEAYRWLVRNGKKFSFELSFPPNNSQGIAYEPWHWRYVGNLASFRTFYMARYGLSFRKP